uniref:Uncharacterized protein n=1 Tax=Rhizophora mucronata TaxID=61149 RepID=A0A2P2NMF9_RHIMU
MEANFFCFFWLPKQRK